MLKSSSYSTTRLIKMFIFGDVLINIGFNCKFWAIRSRSTPQRTQTDCCSHNLWLRNSVLPNTKCIWLVLTNTVSKTRTSPAIPKNVASPITTWIWNAIEIKRVQLLLHMGVEIELTQIDVNDNVVRPKMGVKVAVCIREKRERLTLDGVHVIWK